MAVFGSSWESSELQGMRDWPVKTNALRDSAVLTIAQSLLYTASESGKISRSGISLLQASCHTRLSYSPNPSSVQTSWADPRRRRPSSGSRPW